MNSMYRHVSLENISRPEMAKQTTFEKEPDKLRVRFWVRSALHSSLRTSIGRFAAGSIFAFLYRTGAQRPPNRRQQWDLLVKHLDTVAFPSL